MPAASRLKQLFLAYFSRPKADRLLYRAIRRHKLRRVVELGLGDGRRSVRLIELAQSVAGSTQVAYAGVDLFEMRDSATEPALTLKAAYRRLKATGAGIRLLPGDPFTALSRGANNLLGTDLLIISAGQQGGSLERAWFYVPRMLHSGSHVYLETSGQTADAPSTFRRISLEAVQALAQARVVRRAA